GRGRLGRSWITPPGQALLASTIISLPVSLHADALGWIVHACALSVRHALAARLKPLGHTVTLKWPNDVLVDGSRKICGILAQLAPASSPFTTAVILGYGINIAQAPGTLPTPQATSLLAEGDVQAGTDPTAVTHEVLAAILVGLDERIRSLVAHGDAASAGLAAEAEAALPLIGTRIVLASPTDAFGTPALEGVALGLAPTGALLVRDDDGQPHQIDAGDVLATGTPLTPVHDTKEKRANN
ncbi:MAG: biotin--[acetyl-CoA-carboxylase] ligase, partial [Actinomyces sp.]|nr:biotin--[acetyl-CoA-carboxylase] ligase [Actinomyces sp.]